MYKYAQEGSTDSVIRIADGKIIRMVYTDPLSKAVELWISRGNTPLPADPVKVMEPTKEPEGQDYAGSPDQQPKKKIRKWRELQEKR